MPSTSAGGGRRAQLHAVALVLFCLGMPVTKLFAPVSCRGRGHAVAFTVCNDLLFVATSRNFLLRHDLSGDSSTGAVQLPDAAAMIAMAASPASPFGCCLICHGTSPSWVSSVPS